MGRDFKDIAIGLFGRPERVHGEGIDPNPFTLSDRVFPSVNSHDDLTACNQHKFELMMEVVVEVHIPHVFDMKLK